MDWSMKATCVYMDQGPSFEFRGPREDSFSLGYYGCHITCKIRISQPALGWR